MLAKYLSRERGQAMVMVTLMIIAFVAILALVLDGGMAYASRRKAQNAADAGALAGASYLCEIENPTETEYEIAYQIARDYAVNQNGATRADVSPYDSPDDLVSNSIEVTAYVEYPTPFAAIWGNTTGEAAADARAGCSPVCKAKDVLPIAWACPTRFEGGVCEVQYGDVNGDPLDQPLYIVMDSDNLGDDVLCKDPINSPTALGIDCDLNDDGVDDMVDMTTDNSRSFLNISGDPNVSSSRVAEWVNVGSEFIIQEHMWVPDGIGVNTAVYNGAFEPSVGRIFSLPVYDVLPCPDTTDVSVTCSDRWHTGLDTQRGDYRDTYFHIAAFAAFKLTCVQTPDGAYPDPDGNKYCPGFEELFYDFIHYESGDNEYYKKFPANDLKSIEGYFVRAYVPGMFRCTDGEPLEDLGVRTPNLLP